LTNARRKGQPTGKVCIGAPFPSQRVIVRDITATIDANRYKGVVGRGWRRRWGCSRIQHRDLVLPTFHLSFTALDSRIFDLEVEGTAIVDIDLVKLGQQSTPTAGVRFILEFSVLMASISNVRSCGTGDNGESYIPVGSNTNAGFPCGIMGSGTQLLMPGFRAESSAAILVANMGRPAFNGFITYDAPDNGNPINGFGPDGVEVFAACTRNPIGITLHSNGRLYATDNGPNSPHGPVALNCTHQAPGVTATDKLLLIQRGGYYGHPNHKRAETDDRQCTWRSPGMASQDGYTAPLMRLQSSTCGIIEFESDHFNGQRRGDLILSKYNSVLFRVILSPDGSTINPYTEPAVPLAGFGGLAVTQTPDGSLIDVRHTNGEVHVFKPVEAPSSALDIKAVFPKQGVLAGGTELMIFGVNFSGSPTVTIGDSPLLYVVLVSASKITCTATWHSGPIGCDCDCRRNKRYLCQGISLHYGTARMRPRRTRTVCLTTP
jgi:IPT/TIG domain/Glucose / Sorbosone dehydrogenase